MPAFGRDVAIAIGSIRGRLVDFCRRPWHIGAFRPIGPFGNGRRRRECKRRRLIDDDRRLIRCLRGPRLQRAERSNGRTAQGYGRQRTSAGQSGTLHARIEDGNQAALEL